MRILQVSPDNLFTLCATIHIHIFPTHWHSYTVPTTFTFTSFRTMIWTIGLMWTRFRLQIWPGKNFAKIFWKKLMDGANNRPGANKICDAKKSTGFHATWCLVDNLIIWAAVHIRTVCIMDIVCCRSGRCCWHQTCYLHYGSSLHQVCCLYIRSCSHIWSCLHCMSCVHQSCCLHQDCCSPFFMFTSHFKSRPLVQTATKAPGCE